MSTPTCGHSDGWCGGLLGDRCAESHRPAPVVEPPDPEGAYEQRHGHEPEWRTR